MGYDKKLKILRSILLIGLLMVITALAGLYYGYLRGYDHGEKITNKWWIDQQSRYYDASEVTKNRRMLELDTI